MNYKQTNEKKYNHFFQFCCHCQWCFLVVVFLVVIIANLQRKVCLPKRMIWWWLSTIQSAKQSKSHFIYSLLWYFDRVCSVSCHCCCCCWYLFTDEESEQKKAIYLIIYHHFRIIIKNTAKNVSRKKQKSKIFAKIFKSKNLWFETEFCCF